MYWCFRIALDLTTTTPLSGFLAVEVVVVVRPSLSEGADTLSAKAFGNE